MKDLTNKVAVVTGAASGIGRALALNLAKEGCKLALLDINEEALAETVKLIENKAITVSTHRVDVADREQFHACAEEIIQRYGHVDIVINNAGVAVADSLEDISYENLDWIFGINLGGVIHGIKAFLPHMRERNSGHIVNISSIGGYVSAGLTGSYSATKYAVRSLSETLYVELKGTGVAVTSVHPGGIKTNIAKSSRWGDSLAPNKSKMISEMDKLFSTSPNTAAIKIIQAIKKKKFRLFIGVDSRLVYFLERVSPMFSMWIMGRVSRKVYGR